MKYIVFLAISLVFFSGARGQSYYFRHYQVENGLSNNAVISCVQDKKGFLWFGTKDGLDRFDGVTFKIFRNDPDDTSSIGSNFIHTLYLDPHDVLWVGTENGLYRYDATMESFSLLPVPLNSQVTDIKMDAQDNLWFIMNFNLFKYNINSKSLEQFSTDQYFEATSICTFSVGEVWVSTTQGYLKKYDPVNHKFYSFNLFDYSPKSVSNWIEKLYPLTDGRIAVGTSNQGVKFFDRQWSIYSDVLTYNEDKTEVFARNFVQTSRDELWIASESGIFVYNLSTNKYIHLRKEYNNPYSISDNAVYTFCKDMEGGIWAGTYFGGVSYYPNHPLTFTRYFPDKNRNSLSGNVVREIHQDQYGNLWIGTEDAGLNKLDVAGKFTSYLPTGNKDGISYSNIHGILPDGNELWIGTFEHGLDVMDIRTSKVIRHYSKNTGPSSLRSNFIYCIYKSPTGEIIIGTTIGAYRYNRSADNFTPVEGLPVFIWYSSILQDENGTIWAGTYGNGVYFYNPNTKQAGNFRYNAHNKNSLASERVNSLFQDSDKNLWFATEGGLCKFNKKDSSFTRYTTQTGLPTNFILSLQEDNNKQLWISTSRGLVSWNPKTEKPVVYTKANGLLNDQFNFSSAFKDSTGRMFFGSVKGMISFNPAQLMPTDFKPVVYITGFQVNNKDLVINRNGSPITKSITYTDRISLTHNQSTFSIDFASLSYTAPEMSEYAYMMEGLDKDWTYLKTNRKVYFTELKAGSYTFKVKAASANGSWQGPESILHIEILPPWWASNLAWLSYIAAALIILFLVVRNYHIRTREKNKRKIEQLEIAKEKELYEAKMQFFTNVAHEIKTPLTLIKAPLEKIIKKAGDTPGINDSLRIMEKNTSRLIALTNQLLDFRQTEIKGFSLNFVKTNITELTEDVFLSFKPLAEQKDISLTMAPVTEQICANIDIEAFNKILTNLFSNAVKYSEKKVEVAFLPVKQSGTSFTLQIKNDGYIIPADMKEKIFEPFFRLKATEKQKGTGIGLALSRSLTELQNGKLVLEETENNMNVFSLTLPLERDGN